MALLTTGLTDPAAAAGRSSLIKVMTQQPYASARRVFWIVDNGAPHRGWTAAARLSDAFPNATMIHIPVHASWLNQIEIYFSIVQRKLLTPRRRRQPRRSRRTTDRLRGPLIGPKLCRTLLLTEVAGPRK